MGQGLVIEDKTGRNVAVSYDEKDADLLASAPDLLQALESLLDFQGSTNEATRRNLKSAERSARAAIRKANGEG
jgi:hypothetical protein